MNRFLRKLIMNGIVLIPLLMWFTEATFWSSLTVALIFSAIAYFIGDQFILRISNNTIATLADAGLAFLYLWLVADFMDWTLGMGELLTIVAVLGIVEWIFHRQLGEWDGAQHRKDKRETTPPLRQQFNTEFADMDDEGQIPPNKRD